ncbi:MAG: hypothetical protein ACOYI8_04330 [Christensenellales bacterium]
MFKRRKKPVFRLQIGQNPPILLQELALPEEMILALSVKFFNDPEPCAIHRGAVRNRVLMQLTALKDAPQPVSVDSLDAMYRALFAGETTIRIYEE